MSWDLTKLRQLLTNRLFLALLVGVGVLVLIVFLSPLLKKPGPPAPQIAPMPIAKQPVSEGQFNPQAPESQKSKSAIESLASKLPYRTTFTTSTDTKVTFVIFGKPKDQYTLYVETVGINFQSDYLDPDLAKNVQDFRETAGQIFDWLQKQQVSPTDLFISWGGKAYIQKNAEAWLLESPQYPKVVKKDNTFVFEKEPLKSP